MDYGEKVTYGKSISDEELAEEMLLSLKYLNIELKNNEKWQDYKKNRFNFYKVKSFKDLSKKSYKALSKMHWFAAQRSIDQQQE